MTGGQSRRVSRFFAAVAVVAFGLNLAWEMAQMPAYAGAGRSSWSALVIRHVIPALGDVAITFIVYAIGALAAGTLRWGTVSRWNVYASAALLGGAFATVVEWRALAVGRWAYADTMPIVPVLRVGLWPLVQLVFLTPAAFAIAGWWSRRH